MKSLENTSGLENFNVYLGRIIKSKINEKPAIQGIIKAIVENNIRSFSLLIVLITSEFVTNIEASS